MSSKEPSLFYFKREFRRLNQLLVTSGSQLIEMRDSLDKLSKLSLKDKKLKDFLDSHMSLMSDVMEECYREPNKQHAQRIKEIIKFQKDNKDKWEKIYGYLDMEYHGIITKTKTDYPQLNDKDVLLVALSVMDFSCIQIAIIMGYSNHTSVGTIRKRLGEKMNLEGTLNDYISRFK